MTKYTEINGVEFETIKSKRTESMIDAYLSSGNAYRSIWDCYERPSRTKEEIYIEWRDWFLNAENVFSFGVHAHSCFMFTLAAILYDEEMQTKPIGFIHITKDHNRLYLVSD